MIRTAYEVKKRIKLQKVDTRKLSQGLGLNQPEFWERVEITQGGGSLYESGRPMLLTLRLELGPVFQNVQFGSTSTKCNGAVIQIRH